RIGEIARVKATFAVPEASRLRLREGQAVTLTADALPGRVFAGRITLLGLQADTRARTFPVEVTVGNADRALLPAMVTRLRLPVGPLARRTMAPVDAVATDGDATYVFVIRDAR